MSFASVASVLKNKRLVTFSFEKDHAAFVMLTANVRKNRNKID